MKQNLNSEQNKEELLQLVGTLTDAEKDELIDLLLVISST